VGVQKLSSRGRPLAAAPGAGAVAAEGARGGVAMQDCCRCRCRSPQSAVRSGTNLPAARGGGRGVWVVASGSGELLDGVWGAPGRLAPCTVPPEGLVRAGNAAHVSVILFQHKHQRKAQGRGQA